MTTPTPAHPGPPYYSYPVQQVMVIRQSGLATAALVLGLCTFVTFGATGIPAVVLGILALRDIKRRGVPGQGSAITGLIFGGVAIVGWLAWWALMLVSMMMTQNVAATQY